MPFIAPMIAGALGVGLIGEALIGLGLSFAMGAAARALTPKPKGADPAPIQLAIDSDYPREVAVGYALTAGSLVYHQVYGNKNKNLQLVIALSDAPSLSLEQVYVNGELKSWNSGTGIVDGFDSKLKITLFNGSQTSAPSVLVDNSDGNWTSDDCYRNGTWALVELTKDDKKFPGGIPRFQFVLKGMKLYDPRKDTTVGGSGSHRWDNQSTWEWSDNPALLWYLARRGYVVNGERIFGSRTPSSVIPVADVIAAANACDQTVSLAAGGTEKRYRIGGMFSAAPGAGETIRAILAACAGKEIDSGGVIKLHVGVTRSTVADLTDDDILVGVDATMTPKRPANELINAVFGSYADPAQLYARTALPPRISSTDETADGGRFDATFDLGYVQSQTQGQRVMEILRRTERQQLTFDVPVRARHCALEAGDWITFSSDRFGWVSKTFEVVQVQVAPNFDTLLQLQETSSTVYDWTTGDELDVTDPSDLPGAEPPDADISVTALVTTTLIAPDDTQRPGLTLTWTPPDDTTIDDLLIQYRQVGSGATPMEVIVKDPESGQYTWTSQVQSGITYEARVLAITSPPRPADWSSWVTASGETDIHITALALTVPDGAIPIDKLDEQAAFELGLVTAVDAGLGSLPNLQNAVDEYMAQLGQALGDAQLGIQRVRDELYAEANGARAEVATERIVRATETSALAARIDSVSTTVGTNTTTVQEIAASVDGLRGQWGVQIDSNNRVVGLIRLDGSSDGSAFTIVADRFLVAQPGVDGGDPFPMFAIANVNGTPRVTINGDLVADGGIAARSLAVSFLSAIAADLGEVTAGKLTSADGNSYWDLDTGDFQIAVDV